MYAKRNTKNGRTWTKKSLVYAWTKLSSFWRRQMVMVMTAPFINSDLKISLSFVEFPYLDQGFEIC